MQRLSPTEKRARELSQAVKNIGVAKRPQVSLREITDRYTTQTDELSSKIAPHIKALRDELLIEMKAQPQNIEISTDMVRAIIKEMKNLPEKDRLEVQDIRNHQAFMYKGTKYGMHEMMHGGGPTLTAGSNITLTTTDGTTTVAASSGAISFLSATGTINDVNVTFTFASLPIALIINGALYQQSGGAITWSYLAGTVTLSSPVGTGGSIVGIA